MSRRLIAVPLLLIAPLFNLSPLTAATSCLDLSKLSLPNATIALAQSVAEGILCSACPGRPRRKPVASLPAFCRVQATLKPSRDSDIKMELWMPVAANWNSELRGTGNGGLGGGVAVNAGTIADVVRAGYATAGNNTGTKAIPAMRSITRRKSKISDIARLMR